jgi:hypothetical protein
VPARLFKYGQQCRDDSSPTGTVDRTVADDGEAVETRPWFHAGPISRLGTQLPHAGAFGRLRVRKMPGLALGTKGGGPPG